MRKIAVLSLFLCLVAVCRAQYIGSQYMNVKLGYIVDESQVQGTFGFGKVYKAFKKAKSDLVYLEKSKAFVYGYEVGIRPEMLLSPKVALFAEYRFEMLFNSILRNNNHVGLGCVIYL